MTGVLKLQDCIKECPVCEDEKHDIVLTDGKEASVTLSLLISAAPINDETIPLFKKEVIDEKTYREKKEFIKCLKHDDIEAYRIKKYEQTVKSFIVLFPKKFPSVIKFFKDAGRF